LTAVSDPSDQRLDALVVWIGDLIREHGAGEYLLQVRADGSVVVKRPRKPLEFEWK
jgi:hypothetical protein